NNKSLFQKFILCSICKPIPLIAWCNSYSIRRGDVPKNVCFPIKYPEIIFFQQPFIVVFLLKSNNIILLKRSAIETASPGLNIGTITVQPFFYIQFFSYCKVASRALFPFLGLKYTVLCCKNRLPQRNVIPIYCCRKISATKRKHRFTFK